MIEKIFIFSCSLPSLPCPASAEYSSIKASPFPPTHQPPLPSLSYRKQVPLAYPKTNWFSFNVFGCIRAVPEIQGLCLRLKSLRVLLLSCTLLTQFQTEICYLALLTQFQMEICKGTTLHFFHTNSD